ncbi:MAG: site-specific integrase [Pelagibacterium sp.]|uniref:site-specific integrase n=1 Tax=Pelagibacterium sp. TaxID=1967288 RepID=UPI0032F011C5
MASQDTIAAYRAEAARKITRAVAKYPNLGVLEALFRYVKDYPNKLAANTTRLWRQQLRFAVAEVAKADSRAFSESQIKGFILAMDKAVDGLKGRPDPERTSSKKEKAPSKSQVIAVASHLKSRALDWHRTRMAATALYCLLMPKIGGRPIELVGATVDQGVLVLKNAKRAPGQEVYRPIALVDWELEYRVALAALIDFVDQEVDTRGYAAWLSALAEILARACKAVDVKRLAPSSFRHTALSTWSEAGYSIEEIAKLAGHFSHRSASHYIRTASAWGPEDAVVRSGPAIVPRAEAEAKPLVPDTSDSADDVDFELMPQPEAKPSVSDRSGALWDEYRQRVEQEQKSLSEAVDRLKNERRSASVGAQPRGRAEPAPESKISAKRRP